MNTDFKTQAREQELAVDRPLYLNLVLSVFICVYLWLIIVPAFETAL